MGLRAVNMLGTTSSRTPFGACVRKTPAATSFPPFTSLGFARIHLAVTFIITRNYQLPLRVTPSVELVKVSGKMVQVWKFNTIFNAQFPGARGPGVDHLKGREAIKPVFEHNWMLPIDPQQFGQNVSPFQNLFICHFSRIQPLSCPWSPVLFGVSFDRGDAMYGDFHG